MGDIRHAPDKIIVAPVSQTGGKVWYHHKTPVSNPY